MNIDILCRVWWRRRTDWHVHDLIFSRYRCRHFDRLAGVRGQDCAVMSRHLSQHESRTAELGASSNSDFSWNIAEPRVE